MHSAESVWRLIIANVVGLSNKVLIGNTDLSKGREVDYSRGLGRIRGIANIVISREEIKSRTLLAKAK